MLSFLEFLKKYEGKGPQSNVPNVPEYLPGRLLSRNTKLLIIKMTGFWNPNTVPAAWRKCQGNYFAPINFTTALSNPRISFIPVLYANQV